MDTKKTLHLGLDIGSTTIKLVVLDEHYNLLDSFYRRHHANIKQTLIDLLVKITQKHMDTPITVNVTGSGGVAVSKWIDIPFVQEVIASVETINVFIPETDVAIELGGEDAKITFFGHGIEQRMNGTCAGGTGAFIDQMAALLNTDASGLNTLAKGYSTIYPIAARCGVFAKSDIQPLLNEGARKEDIAVSVFQSVVNQTISGLACGRSIKGKVAFLGGPLHFMDQLRDRFIDTLNLGPNDVIAPNHSQLFVAIGAAIHSTGGPLTSCFALTEKLKNYQDSLEYDVKRLPALFQSEEELIHFKKRHAASQVKRGTLSEHDGASFLGIDCGSTTTKLVLIDEQGTLLHTDYRHNEGSPLAVIKKAMLELYTQLNKNAYIVNAVVTGYGESLIQAALNIDIGEIETVAHQRAAEHFLPGVDFILDIGGQDMKCIKTHEGVIHSVVLNEACSAGCGSFLQNFADSLNLTLEAFVEASMTSKKPVDLGSRCTVFMNSKVKQAQKEGTSVGDIASGLAYSVVKNALYKVIRLKNTEELGENIVVQGGTFHNDAVLRAFEQIIGRDVVRPDIAGLMGAYGAALLAIDRHKPFQKSNIISASDLEKLNTTASMTRCKLCANQCILTTHSFSENRTFTTGNRCERGVGLPLKKSDIPNLFKYKNDRLFNYKSLQKVDARRGVVGIPRVLNLFENYPFWFTFFNTLGFRVELSPKSSRKLYETGMESMPSESACYPAKLSHGHIAALLKRDIDFIFYPSVLFEQKEDQNANNQFNCPIVTSYPEVIKSNVDFDDAPKKIEFLHPFISFHDPKAVQKTLIDVFSVRGIPKHELKKAVDAAFKEDQAFKSDMRHKGELALTWMRARNLKGIVLAGRPYHVDEEINHGIDKLITDMNFVVLTEDAIAHLSPITRPLRVVDQWVYHTRLYAAAEYVAKTSDLELVQLNSFGCGLDAVTSDQVEEILKRNNKLFTLLKIDEVNNLGSAKIRLRSLKAAMHERDRKDILPAIVEQPKERIIFTKKMRKTHTILAPQMAPMHFDFVEAALRAEGYRFVLLSETTDIDLNNGLKYVNNDACYPSILVVGQIMTALQSGIYDLKNTSVLVTQTGGGCRATNYIAFIRKALKDAGLEDIPVISLNSLGFEPNPGFKLSFSMIKRGLQALLYGDLLMRLTYRVRPYEINDGETDALANEWNDKLINALLRKDFRHFKKNTRKIVESFASIPMHDGLKPRVGLVGEILVKYHPYANNNIVDIIEAEGGEAVMPDLFDFILYTLKNGEIRASDFYVKSYQRYFYRIVIRLLEGLRKPMIKALSQHKKFGAPIGIDHLAKGAEQILSLGHQTGEGWFLTGEMVELIEAGVKNVVCMQPFACLPNHVTGKGMIKALRTQYPGANIVAVDYDPGASEVNQLNRIKLMMSTAHKALNNTKS